MKQHVESTKGRKKRPTWRRKTNIWFRRLRTTVFKRVGRFLEIMMLYLILLMIKQYIDLELVDTTFDFIEIILS